MCFHLPLVICLLPAISNSQQWQVIPFLVLLDSNKQILTYCVDIMSLYM